jgi:hypothetical protein
MRAMCWQSWNRKFDFCALPKVRSQRFKVPELQDFTWLVAGSRVEIPTAKLDLNNSPEGRKPPMQSTKRSTACA